MAKDGDVQPEVKARAGAMASTVGAIRKPVPRVSVVPVDVRLYVLSSLAVSQLLHNARVLAPLPPARLLPLHAERTRAIRIVRGA
eukprot:9834854-Alexandrium_andersonii.AAC.1